jgi:hypothetical protein
LKEKALLFVGDNDGCGHLKGMWVQEELARQSDRVEIEVSTRYHKAEEIQEGGYTSLIFHRQCTDKHLEMWHYYRNLSLKLGEGYKMYYVMDDDMFNINPVNKVAYDYYDSQKLYNALRMMKGSYMTIVLNERQKALLVERGVDEDKIVILPNYMPEAYRVKKKKYVNEKPVILCALTSSYKGEYEWLLPLMERTKDKWLWKVSGMWSRYHVHNGIEYHPFYKPNEYMQKLHELQPDIGLNIKLADIFNIGRQSLKPLEYGYLGIPAITSKFEGFEDKNAVIRVENDLDVIEIEIEKLLSNKDYKKRVIAQQYGKLRGKWLKSNVDKWEDVLCGMFV